MVHITGNDGTSARFTMDAFGTGSFASFIGRAGRGTAANPLPLQVGDVMARFSATGWAEPGYNTTNTGGPPTSIDFVATDNYTHDTYGSKIQLYTSPSGSGNIARKLSAEVDSTGLNLPTGSDFKIGGNSYTASLATTGSNTFNGNQTITGSLTLSSGSQLNINDGFYVNGNKQFNYGQFSDLTIQSGSADTAYPMKLNTTDVSMGVSVVSGSFIKVDNTGTYNLQFSTQLDQTSNHAAEVSIWLRKDGTDIPNSNTELTIEKIGGGGKMVAAWNYMVQLNANQYVQLMWSSTRSDTQLHYHATQTTPTRPATPSVIVTVTQVA
jgi:hypothetical protein